MKEEKVLSVAIYPYIRTERLLRGDSIEIQPWKKDNFGGSFTLRVWLNREQSPHISSRFVLLSSSSLATRIFPIVYKGCALVHAPEKGQEERERKGLKNRRGEKEAQEDSIVRSSLLVKIVCLCTCSSGCVRTGCEFVIAYVRIWPSLELSGEWNYRNKNLHSVKWKPIKWKM